VAAWAWNSLVALSLCAGLAAALPRAASAGGPPEGAGTAQPILRIETGTHTTSIAQIGVDAADLYVVTGSPDRTVRVWDFKSGELLRIIRPPLADRDEGKIYALALSPDGRTIACAGATGGAFEGSYVVYLFDRASGRLMRRLTGLPAEIHHLAFSPDGRFLAATFGPRPAGIRVYGTADWSLLREDRSYEDVTLGADFDRTGHLVTASYDRFIRLYDTSFRVIAKVPTPGGKRPRSVSYAPGGKEIAVGFDDVPLVAVLSGANLTSLVFPDMAGV
jgi:WD40 repeat protein